MISSDCFLRGSYEYFECYNRIGPATVSASSKQRSTHEQAIHKHAQHLSKEKRDSIIETVRNLQASGESVEEIQYVVDHFFEDNGSFLLVS